MEALVKDDHAVGDLGFCALRLDGEQVPLRKREDADPNAAKAEPPEWVFYSAVQPAVLQEMAKDPNKAVILVARHSDRLSKVPIIYASVGGATKRRYASRLIVDERTAQTLHRY